MSERMTSLRTNLLRIIAKEGDKEINYFALCNISNTQLHRVEKDVSLFAKRGFIVFCGGGYFKITALGRDYLNNL